MWGLDEETCGVSTRRLVEIDQTVPRKEETVLFDPKDEDVEGVNADESSVEDAGSSIPASKDPSSSSI